jgi:hypothetical protein
LLFTRQTVSRISWNCRFELDQWIHGMRFLSVLVFRPLLLCRFMWLKRKGRLKPATIAQFFLIASGYAVKIRRWC